MFILPKKVLKEINNVCSAYIWNGDESNTTHGNVRWTKVCTKKKYGGIGVRKLEIWKVDEVGKIEW